VIWHLIKDAEFRDNPENPHYTKDNPPHERVIPLYTTDLPEVHHVVRGLRRVMDEFTDRLLIGEIYLPLDRLVTYYGAHLDGAHLPFNFSLLHAKWDAHHLAKLIEDYELILPQGGWPNWVLGNHDQVRIASRVGTEQAHIAAILLLTLRGTPTIYYGDEIGLPQVNIPPERVCDPFERNVPGIGIGRDGARTPMQWNADKFAGFSDAEPWLPLTDDWKTRNVESLGRTGDSMYNLYRRLITLRRRYQALQISSYHPIASSGALLLYIREWEQERILVVLNLGNTPDKVTLAPEHVRGTILLSSGSNRDENEVNEHIRLAGNEGLVIMLSSEMNTPHSVR
jgi:alpha-glucosidase